MSTGTIVGAVVGSVCGLIVFAAVGILFLRCRPIAKQRQWDKPAAEYTPASVTEGGSDTHHHHHHHHHHSEHDLDAEHHEQNPVLPAGVAAAAHRHEEPVMLMVDAVVKKEDVADPATWTYDPDVHNV